MTALGHGHLIIKPLIPQAGLQNLVTDAPIANLAPWLPPAQELPPIAPIMPNLLLQAPIAPPAPPRPRLTAEQMQRIDQRLAQYRVVTATTSGNEELPAVSAAIPKGFQHLLNKPFPSINQS